MYHIVQNHGKSTVKSSTTGKGDIIMIIDTMILICSCYVKKSTTTKQNRDETDGLCIMTKMEFLACIMTKMKFLAQIKFTRDTTQSFEGCCCFFKFCTHHDMHQNRTTS